MTSFVAHLYGRPNNLHYDQMKKLVSGAKESHQRDSTNTNAISQTYVEQMKLLICIHNKCLPFEVTNRVSSCDILWIKCLTKYAADGGITGKVHEYGCVNSCGGVWCRMLQWYYCRSSE